MPLFFLFLFRISLSFYLILWRISEFHHGKFQQGWQNSHKSGFQINCSNRSWDRGLLKIFRGLLWPGSRLNLHGSVRFTFSQFHNFTVPQFHNSTSFPDWLLFDSNVLEPERGKTEKLRVYLCSQKYTLFIDCITIFYKFNSIKFTTLFLR